MLFPGDSVVTHMAHLTKRQIDAAVYRGTGNSRDVRWDDDPHGLGLRIYPGGGRKTFVLSYRANGTKRLMTLGDYGVLTLEQGRKAARRALQTVETEHADPLLEKRRAASEARTGTVQAMFDAYVEARISDPRRPMKAADYPRRLARLYITPRFGARRTDDIKRSEIREWHGSLANVPVQANRALQYLKAAFQWRLAQSDDRPDKRADARNPCWGVVLYSERPRTVRLELAELPKLEAAIDTETNDPYLRAFLRFVLATGCRRSEALKLQWKDVKMHEATGAVVFRDTKGGGDRSVPLSAYATRLLRTLPRIKGNPHVFVGRSTGAHIVAPDKAWGRIRSKANLGHLRMHDLRRTFGSWLGEAGFTSKQIGSTLGHKTDITSRVYMALGESSKRATVDAVEQLIVESTSTRHSQQ
jgi:integrase